MSTRRQRSIVQLILLTTLAWGRESWSSSPIESDLDKLAPLSLMELLNTPVVTASRQNETRDRTPAHIMVFTRKQIRERRYKNLADLLEDLPGVGFMHGTKSANYNNFTVQGYNGPNKLVLMLDGVRVGNPAGGDIPVAENFALYPARQVEVLFGPAAALYGADAVAGVINIITDHAGEQQGSRGSVGAGNFGSHEVSFMTGFKTDGALSVNVGGHWQYSDRAPLQDYYPADFAKSDARTFDGTTVIPAAARENYVGAIRSHSLYARMDLGDKLTLGFYRNVFRSLTSTGDRPETALYLDDAPWITQIDTVHGKYRFDPTANLSGEVIVDYSVQEVDPMSKYVNIYTAFTNGNEYSHIGRYSIEQNLNWKLDDNHRIQSGLGYQKYFSIAAHSLPIPYDTDKGPDAQGMVYSNTSLPLDIYEASYDNVSAYAQLQSQWNAQFSTMVGLRLDRHSAYGQSLNPRLGAIWRVNDRHLLKALYGTAFRAPSPDESLSSFGVFDGTKNSGGLYIGTGFRVPNFTLQPEKARTLSLSWDWRPRQDLNLVTNVYQSQIQNLIVTMPSTNVNAIPGAILIAPETKGNAGGQTQHGIDLITQWRFNISSAWSGDLWGSASWVKGKINEGDGNEWDLSYVANRTFKLGTTFRYLDKITITPRILWVGDTTNGRKADARNPPTRLETPGYTLTNLHIGWHNIFDGKATLWLDVSNLFDMRYYSAGGSGSRTFFDMPQPPRGWMASLEYRF